MSRDGEEHTDIVPVHASGRNDRRCGSAAEFGSGQSCVIERRHDTILYRYISNLSISEIKTYRYLAVETSKARVTERQSVAGPLGAMMDRLG
jgi:hypothetical protein